MNSKLKNLSPKKINYKELLKPYLRNWHWFVLAAIIGIALAVIKIRYSVPQYAVQAKIQILEDQNSTSELDVFRDLSGFGGGRNRVEDEIEVLNSRSNMVQVVKQLGLNKRIIAMGNIQHSDMYQYTPINISFLAPDSIVHRAKKEFFISLKSDTSFEMTAAEDEPALVYLFGKKIPTVVGDVVITPNIVDFGPYINRRYKITVNPLTAVAEQYQKKIKVSVTKEESNIIALELEDQVIERGKDVINALIFNYNQNAITDKKAIADRTSSFIDDRIASIYGDLSSVDDSAEDFKSDRGISDIGTQTNLNLNIGAANQQELQNASVQLDIASSMKDIVDNQVGYELMPSNVGLSDGSIAATTARYNELAMERKRLLESSNERNPIIVNLDQQLAGLKRNMQSSLNSVTNNLALQVNSLSSQLSRINSRIYSAPKNERALRDITRQQQTTEQLYLYLLQKREESQITFASASPKSKIIDKAFLANNAPVSPKKTIILLAHLILGLMVPFSVIYAKELLDNKVHNKIGLEKLVGDIPVLAELPKLSKKESKLILKDDRSVMAESLRILRTNLDYLIKAKTGPGKKNVIFITSSVSGEGKTFVSTNLAMILANTNKKVLLIGADIRNPKLYTFLTNKNVAVLGKQKVKRDIGLTEFLYDDSLSPKDLVHSMLVHTNNIDVVYSGKIPPNPAELLMSDKLKGLFEEFSESYDYVIVDTAPLFVVTDTLLISQYANHIIYVTRAGATEKAVLEFPLKLQEEGKLKGLSFIVNDVKDTNLGYGGKYGYGYGSSMKKWWKF
ncbi:Tyrosine-protein kinase ptk [Arenibacter antarcticus]|uniref:non-specific protein-tyrosine kinase n=1 Tax=Arenibacter antarcticus TaxID=2040469 RepID=A0ABW5VJ87_9FLAO|nr:polysaccharide biosynthesis tyrosine autokinase [Arenibacter sp. H213]MCM4167355.1 tyrosine protein kinase [Arenibacter sp. H213]